MGIIVILTIYFFLNIFMNKSLVSDLMSGISKKIYLYRENRKFYNF